jgi:hypothetical protein
MTKVAADYGVAGTALKKTCDRHHIPTPERGCWARGALQCPVQNLTLSRVSQFTVFLQNAPVLCGIANLKLLTKCCGHARGEIQ